MYHNDDQLRKTLISIKEQTIKPKQILIIDDYSKLAICSIPSEIECKVEIIKNKENRGRGYSRNLGVIKSVNEFIVFCDSTNSLCSDFIEKALNSFSNEKTTAVYGRITGRNDHTDICSRWRERNLFLETYPYAKEPYEVFSLSTGGVMIRKSHVLKIGNFDSELKQFEDHQLGTKLIKKGYQIFFNPNLFCTSNRKDNLFQLAKRVDRWYSPSNESFNVKSFIDLIKTSLFIWIKRDLDSKDYSGIFVSLIIPFLIIFQNINKCFPKQLCIFFLAAL